MLTSYYYRTVSMLVSFHYFATVCICMSNLEVGASVLSRFSCTLLGKATQTCRMKCNFDGTCSEKLRIVACDCNGYGEETFDTNYYKVSNLAIKKILEQHIK